jgi:hypothetical protein
MFEDDGAYLVENMCTQFQHELITYVRIHSAINAVRNFSLSIFQLFNPTNLI